MKISEAIKQLQDTMSQYGDLPIYTWDGEVTSINATPGRDGLDMISVPEDQKPNEICIELWIKSE